MRAGRAFACVAIMLSAATSVASAQAVGERIPPTAPAVGERIEVRVEDLPPPGATPSVAAPPQRIARPAGANLNLPPGLRANAFASGFRHARYLHVAPNGDVFLAELRAGRISVLRDADGDGVAETVRTFAEGLNLPHGLAIRGDWLYVGEVGRILRFAYRAGDLAAGGPAQVVTAPGALGSGGGHVTRNIVFAPDGRRFFVSVGSAGNTGEESAPRATIQVFNADGGGQRTFAAGLRNAIGMAIRPGTDELWTVVNERDGLGDGLPPDYLAHVRDGDFFGWPYAYAGTFPDPEYGARRPDLVAQAKRGDVLFRAHSAPIDLVFYDGAQFPEYRGDAFVTLQGSWNASRPVGFMVARVPFADGRPRGWYEPFVTGFLLPGDGGARTWGRPAGIAVARDGSLLFAEDANNTVWRVSRQR